VTDIQSGASATADITATIAAETKLKTDVGATATRSVTRQLNDLGRDLTDLGNDLSQVGKDVREDAAEITTKTTALTTALGSITLSTAAQGDVTALKADLAKVTTDLAAGNGMTAVTDLNAASADLTKLKTDLGTTATPAITQAINTLNHSVTDLARDLSVMSHFMNKNVADIQSDIGKLSTALASNTNTTVMADVKDLNAKLATVVSEAATGSIKASDLKALIDAETKLSTDLGTSATRSQSHMLRDLHNDSMALAIERLAFFA
jgi:hypothetical protein